MILHCLNTPDFSLILTLCPESKLHASTNFHHAPLDAVSPPPGRLREQRGDPEEAPVHQGGRGGIRIRGRALPSPADAPPRQAGPRPALPPALPPALATAAGQNLQAAERPRPARQPADPCGELQLRAAGPQPKVRNRTPILPFPVRLLILELSTGHLFTDLGYI